MKYRDMTPEQKEARQAYNRKYYEEHREELLEGVKKWQSEHKEAWQAYLKKWKSEHKEVWRAYMRKYQAENINSNGNTKLHIRIRSGRILKRVHAKLDGYQIHHCFGYEDANKFIYIPKYLHTQIHRMLKDKKIPADSDHWNDIRELVNSCEDYTYIRT